MAADPQSESRLARLLAPREPRLARLLVLSAILLLWIAVLVILYFTSVRLKAADRPASTGVGFSVIDSRLL